MLYHNIIIIKNFTTRAITKNVVLEITIITLLFIELFFLIERKKRNSGGVVLRVIIINFL